MFNVQCKCPSLCNCHADGSTECDRLLTVYASSIKPSLPYLGLLWSPSFLLSLAPVLQSCFRRNLSLALSRFIGVELHGEESSVAVHRTEHFSTCANLKVRVPSFPFVQFKFSVYGHTQRDKRTHASCNAVTLVWGSLRLAPMIVDNKICNLICQIP